MWRWRLIQSKHFNKRIKKPREVGPGLQDRHGDREAQRVKPWDACHMARLTPLSLVERRVEPVLIDKAGEARARDRSPARNTTVPNWSMTANPGSKRAL